MIHKKPNYYDEFHCIATACEHCCCYNWEIEVDEQTYQSYMKEQDEFGEKLKANIVKKEDKRHFKMIHGKCPFLTTNQLCGIYQKLGEQAMCDVCTEYPRFEVSYNDHIEHILALSCEEVGRIMYGQKDGITFCKEVQEETTDSSMKAQTKIVNEAILNSLFEVRDYCIALIQDREFPLEQRIFDLLRYSALIQQCLDMQDYDRIHKIIKNFKKLEWQPQQDHILLHQHFQKRMDVLMDMEVMEEEWIQEMNNVMRAFYADSMAKHYESMAVELKALRKDWNYEYEHMIIYFLYRYAILAVEDNQFLDKIKFSILSFLTIRDMDRMRLLIEGMSFTFHDRVETSRIFCKQVEHSQKCMSYLESKIQTESVFELKELMLEFADEKMTENALKSMDATIG